MHKRLSPILACLLLMALLGCKNTRVPDAEWEIVIDGDVESTQTFNYAQMAKSKLKPFEYLAVTSSGDNYMTEWKGITFSSMIERTGVKHNQFTIDTHVLLTFASGRTLDVTLAQLRGASIALQDGAGNWLAETQPDAPILLVAPGIPVDDWLPVVRFTIVKSKK